MITSNKKTLLVAVILTFAIFILWQFTGGDVYTKYQVVEEVEKELDQNDPLVVAGFYDNNKATETIARNEFRLGLLPTPSGIIDKHSVAVVTLLTPVWLIAFTSIWLKRRKTIRALA